jgi:hypothetical protein
MPRGTKRDITPKADDLWRGIGGNFDNLTQIICEFVDNSISNFIGNPGTYKDIWIDVKKSGNQYNFKIEDTGTGFDKFEVAMKLGDMTGGSTPLNEHGFGMKHALATACPTNKKWAVYTQTKSDLRKSKDRVRFMKSPYKFMMYEQKQKTWPGRHKDTGTQIQFTVNEQMFFTLRKGRKGGGGFAKCCDYLKEDLGFIYSTILDSGAANIQVNGNPVSVIRPNVKGSYDPTPTGEESKNINLGSGNVEMKFHFIEIEDPTDSEGKKYYKKNTKQSGVEIRINGRAIQHNIFSDVWTTKAGNHNLYNHFFVLIDLISDENKKLPRTRTSKNGVREADKKIAKVFDWIRNTCPDPPKNPTEKFDEKKMADQLKIVKDGAYSAMAGSKVKREYSVWKTEAAKNRPKADLYIFDGTTEVILYECKLKNTRIQDVYQLIMYWDGSVDDSTQPTKAFLVGGKHSKAVKNAVKRWNKLKDANGKKYNINLTNWTNEGVIVP